MSYVNATFNNVTITKNPDSFNDTDAVTKEYVDKTNGNLNGDLTIPSNSYLYIGTHWRIKATNDGSQLVYQYNSNPNPDRLENNWINAMPYFEVFNNN